MSIVRKAGVCAVVLSTLLAVFLNYPAPDLSDRLKQWKARGQHFSFKGHKIFYINEKGTGSGVVVCLHGFPTFSYDWSKVFDGLKRRFGRVIAADFIGYGFSDKPLEHTYSIFEQADIIEDLLQQLGVERVNILAHDYGDTVALELLARHEEAEQPAVEIESTCLLNGGIFPETNFPRWSQKLLLVPYVGAILNRLTFFRLFKKAFGEVFGPNTQPTEEEFEDFWAAIHFKNGNLVSYKLLQYIPERSANKGRWVGVLQVTAVPIHVIYGPADPVNPPVFAEHYIKFVPKPSLIVLSSDISHYPQFENPDVVIKAYTQWLDSLQQT